MANIDRNVSGSAVELTLNGTMSSGTPGDGGTFTLNGDVSGWPGSWGIILLDPDGTQEKILYSARAGNSFTVATGGRGFDGTVASNHSNSTKARHILDAALVSALVNHVNSTAADHHTQYLNVVRHDDPLRHQGGTTIPVGVPGALTFGASADQGTSSALARSDHRHSAPAYGATGAMVAETVGVAASGGSATAVARIDHVHAMPDAATLGVVPTGGLVQYAGIGSPPAGWLLCDGAAVSRATYAALFTAIGTGYGVGNGTTTFNLPNLKGRVPVGLDPAQSEFDALGETGGAKVHTLITAELPSHNHTVSPPSVITLNNGNHAHRPSNLQAFITTGGPASAGLSVSAGGDYTNYTDTGGDHTHTVNQSPFASGNAGSTTAHQNLQPYVIVNYLVKI